MIIPPYVQTFFFKLHSATLPVKANAARQENVCCLVHQLPPVQVPGESRPCFYTLLGCGPFWDVLKRILRKELYITPHSIRFLPVPKNESVPHDVLIALGLYSIWRSRMTVRHADPHPKTVHVFFSELISQAKAVLHTQTVLPDWAGVLEEILTARWL